MKYLQKSFSVAYGETKEYRKNYEHTFGIKSKYCWVTVGNKGEQIKISEEDMLEILREKDRVFDIWAEEIVFDSMIFRKEICND